MISTLTRSIGQCACDAPLIAITLIAATTAAAYFHFACMDPQQRWLLETTWEALEDAGYPPANLAGSNVGVFIGISGSDYGDVQKRSRFDVDAYTNSGNALSIAANRISFLFDFRGPSFAVDTACSSSMVALDLACQALSRGDVPAAIVGGANSLFTPDLTIGFSNASMLSPDGRCKPFDAAANGYVRAEGAVSMVLRPLDKALANGDRIYAVIRATCMSFRHACFRRAARCKRTFVWRARGPAMSTSCIGWSRRMRRLARAKSKSRCGRRD